MKSSKGTSINSQELMKVPKLKKRYTNKGTQRKKVLDRLKRAIISWFTRKHLLC